MVDWTGSLFLGRIPFFMIFHKLSKVVCINYFFLIYKASRKIFIDVDKASYVILKSGAAPNIKYEYTAQSPKV